MVFVYLPVPLPLVDLSVSLALIAAGKLSPALAAGERLLTSVCADVRGQVVTPAEAAHADAALEWLLTCVHAYMPRQLIGTREAPFTTVSGTSIRTLVWWRFALQARGDLLVSGGFCEVSLVDRARGCDLRVEL